MVEALPAVGTYNDSIAKKGSGPIHAKAGASGHAAYSMILFVEIIALGLKCQDFGLKYKLSMRFERK